MGMGDKGGASLQTAGLSSVVSSMRSASERCTAAGESDKLKAAFMESEEYRGAVRKAVGFAIAVAEDMQFGMSDLEVLRKDRELVRRLSEQILQEPEHLDTQHVLTLSPKVRGNRAPSIIKTPRYSSMSFTEEALEELDEEERQSRDEERRRGSNPKTLSKRESGAEVVKGTIVRRQTGGTAMHKASTQAIYKEAGEQKSSRVTARKPTGGSGLGIEFSIESTTNKPSGGED